MKRFPTIQARKTYDVEYRLRTKNRGYRWYRAVGKPTRRPDGSPKTYVGVFLDITGRKEMLQELAQQRESPSVALEEANQANKSEQEKTFRFVMEALAHNAYFGDCRKLMKKDNITEDELDNHNYLYKAYHSLGLNGTGDRMHEIILDKPVDP